LVKLVGFLRHFGQTGRRLGWNYEFRRGAWFVGARSQQIISLVETYGPGKRIVELGCGDGSLARHIQHVPHRSYFGLDISDMAITVAREIADSRYSFAAGSFEDWQPVEPFDLLIMEECLYYLAPRRQLELLATAAAAMPSGSVALFAIRNNARHEPTIDRVRRQGRVLHDTAGATRNFVAIEIGSAPPSAP
jgi:SAM-dependent methyltransferase